MKKYLKDGRKVELVKEIEGGFLVQDVLTAYDDEQYLDDTIYFVDELYDSPPKEVYYIEIQKLLNEIEKLKETKEKLGKSVHNLRAKQLKLQNQIITASRQKIHINFS